MLHRPIELNPAGNLVFRSPPNAAFLRLFGLLSVLHAGLAIPAFWHGRWEGFLSAAFCVLFAAAAIVCWCSGTQVILEKETRQIRVRTGIGPLGSERTIPFFAITGVRVTLAGVLDPDRSQIELLCPNYDLRCPSLPTCIRQEALLLAMTLDVPLIKVFSDQVQTHHERADALAM